MSDENNKPFWEKSPVHEVKEPKCCDGCNGDGFSSKNNKCSFCGGEGGWPKGWYFWDEVWVDRLGPYKSEEEANEKCREYAQQL